jgi:hypothetical protein
VGVASPGDEANGTYETHGTNVDFTYKSHRRIGPIRSTAPRLPHAVTPS